MLADQAQIVDASQPNALAPTSVEQRRPSTSFLLAFAAPWIGLVRPSTAGSLFANSSVPVFGTVLLTYVITTICLTLLVMAWQDSVRIDYAPLTFEGVIVSDSATFAVLKTRPIFEVLRSWHDPDQVDTIDAVILIVLVVAIGLTLFLAWLRLADHHEGGSAWRSYFRCWKCVFALTGFVLLVEALLWVPITVLDHLNARMSTGKMIPIPWVQYLAQSFWNVPFAPIVNFVAILWILHASGRAVRGGRQTITAIDYAPVCEGCGYDLSHQDRDGRCPECGRDVLASLTAGLTRRPTTWEFQGPTIQAFLKTSHDVLISMVSTYSSMEVRSSEKLAERFRGIHYFLISLSAGFWGFICILVSLRGRPTMFQRTREQDLVESAAGALLVFLLASIIPWIVQHVLAALSYTWWLIRKSLPDPRWSRKVLAYETAFLWLFCCFNGTFITSFMIFGTWITDTFGQEFTNALVGEPPEVVLMFGGNAFLCFIWLYRYQLAMKAIRWANH